MQSVQERLLEDRPYCDVSGRSSETPSSSESKPKCGHKTATKCPTCLYICLLCTDRLLICVFVIRTIGSLGSELQLQSEPLELLLLQAVAYLRYMVVQPDK